ncbi:MAG: class I tRNA ligase family protein, partial [Patescibacteria group bacterium]
ERYDHRAIEKKWQERWEQSGAFNTPDEPAQGRSALGGNFYFLTEFPYPSGNLHVGHWYAFSVPDIFARYMRMRGYNVLYPIGFDAFGLPAENAAIKNRIHPREWTFGNIDYMRGQLRSMGATFDWSREVITADPKYYKWTQWLFLQFYKKGLVYRKETAVNWCPKDLTVLANEQVVDGKCERCGTEVEQRNLPQWNIKITDYADRLIDDLAPLDWPKQIKDAQINWIGRSEGAEIDFALTNGGKLTVFTTRPDTLFGATYMVVAPEHPIVGECADDDIKKYVKAAGKKTELERSENKEKTGVELKGVKAINPATQEEIPIYVADYVLGGYGTGAIMAVPAHDERDFEFAKKFGLSIKEVVEPTYEQTTEPGKIREGEPFDHREAIIAIVKHWAEDTYIALKWKQVAWGTFITGGIEEGQSPEEAARMELEQEVGYTDAKFIKDFGIVHGKFYHVPKKTNRNAHAHVLYFELQSDARKPVAAEEDAIHEVLWLTTDELKKFLTPDTHQHGLRWLVGEQGVYTAYGTLANSGEFNRVESAEAIPKITAQVGGRLTKQYRLRDWVVSRQRFWGVPIPMIHCEKCGYNPVPEDQLPVVLPDLEDYLPTGEGKSPLAKKRGWVEVVCPSCNGPAERETDTLDTFVDSSWYYQRYADPHNETVFAAKDKLQNWLPVNLYSGGSEHTTMHLLYSRFWHKAMHDLGLVSDSEPYIRRMNRGLIMGPDGQKMSKSRGNVVDPDAAVQELGADTVRMYLAFIGPYNEVGAYPWTPGGAVGVRRFLDRAWRLVPEDIPASPELEMLVHQTIKKVGDDIAALKMNTAVSALMILLNKLEEGAPKDAYKIFIQLLMPFAPHIAHELAERAGWDWSGSPPAGGWPAYDEAQLVAAQLVVAVQVNGKVRATVSLAADAPEDEALAAAKAAAAKWIGKSEVKKAVYVPGRVINFIV